MADADINDQDLLDYDEEEQPQQKEAEKKNEKNVKGSYVSIHSSGFRDFLLKPELSKAIVDCGFEHPSQVRINPDEKSANFLLGPKRVHPPGRHRYGRRLPGQVRYG